MQLNKSLIVQECQASAEFMYFLLPVSDLTFYCNFFKLYNVLSAVENKTSVEFSFSSLKYSSEPLLYPI